MMNTSSFLGLLKLIGHMLSNTGPAHTELTTYKNHMDWEHGLMFPIQWNSTLRTFMLTKQPLHLVCSISLHITRPSDGMNSLELFGTSLTQIPTTSTSKFSDCTAWNYSGSRLTWEKTGQQDISPSDLTYTIKNQKIYTPLHSLISAFSQNITLTTLTLTGKLTSSQTYCQYSAQILTVGVGTVLTRTTTKSASD